MGNKLSYWIRSGSYALLTRISITAFGLVNFVLLIKLISQNEFGIWTLFLSVTMIFESLRNAFIGNPFIRYLNNEDRDEVSSRDVISSAFYLNLMTAFLVTLFMLLFSVTLSELWDAPQISDMFKVYIISAFAYTWFSHYNFLMQSKLSFKGTFFSTMVQKGGLTAYILYIYLSDHDTALINLAWASALSHVLSAMVAAIFALKERQFNWSVSKEMVLSLANYGKWTLGTNVSVMINTGVNDWFLATFNSLSAVAIYNPAVRISNLFEVPLAAVSQIFYPKMVSSVKENGLKEARYMYEKSLGFILPMSAGIFVFLFVLADPIITLLSSGATESFSDSVPVLRVVLISSLLIPFQRQFGVTMIAIGKAHINFYFVIISSVVSIIIKYFFVVNLGIMGAAWGAVLSFSLDFIAVQIILNKILGVKILNIFRYTWEILTTFGTKIKV